VAEPTKNMAKPAIFYQIHIGFGPITPKQVQLKNKSLLLAS
jgi:hypothetical protein